MSSHKKEKSQVTLSKFFTSSSKKKSNHNSGITTDEKDDFEVEIIEKKSSKRKLPESESTTNSKKKKNSGSNEASSPSPDGARGNNNNGQAKDNNGHQSVPYKTKSPNKKLQQFNLEEGSGSHDGPIDISQLTSKNCLTIDFTPSGHIASSATLNGGSDEEEDSSSRLASSSSKPSSSTTSKKSSKKASYESLSSGAKLTPLEKQVVQLKADNPGKLLLVEVGYKYKFFGEDAEIAAKVLKIVCHPDHNFMIASIPVHRLFVHVRRLVSAGYKVGVVKQTETAHLKAAGDNKAGPFERKLTALYTKSTLIGEDVDSASGDDSIQSPSLPDNHYLMCIYEQPRDKESSSKNSQVGLVCVDPATGDVVHDSFDDSATFTELETRISHLKPVEVLLSAGVSDGMHGVLTDISALSATDDDRIRIEKMDGEQFLYTQAFETVSEFYSKDPVSLQTAVNFSKPVVSCLAALMSYLKDFKLDNILSQTSHFRQFSTRASHMHLSGQCLRNLEVFNNSYDGSERGSLFWMLNHTKTKFGARLLRRWISQPLLDKGDIEARQDAVEEILKGSYEEMDKVKDMMTKLPDVERGLCSIYHKKCSAVEFVNVTKSLEKMQKQMLHLQQRCGSVFQSPLLLSVCGEVPELLADIARYSTAINEKAAKENDKKNLFIDDSQFPAVYARKKEIESLVEVLNEHRREVRLALRQPALQFVTVSQIEFLIEVKNKLVKEVPKDWTQISSTKQVSRFHSPFIVKNYRKLNELKEKLILDVTTAWQKFLEQFSNNFRKYKKAVNYVATLDCLMSLAKTASQDSFCKPIIDPDNIGISICQGRHPIIDALQKEQEQYVPNDTQLKGEDIRVIVISGPNMGGKSSYIRQVALITILAQIGSYIPAESAHIGIVDAVYTRMGAADDIFKGRSTFMLELQEASDIMSQVGDRSLVILDELGRGTSTHDGVAIAHATLHHFVTKCKCLLLFVTHFPMMSEFQEMFPKTVANYHMAFLLNAEDEDGNNSPEAITFLYQLTEGAAKKSYGLNVARLADIEPQIIKVAHHKSTELENSINQKLRAKDMFMALWTQNSSMIKEVLDQHLTAHNDNSS